MFNRASLHVRRPPAFVVPLAALMVGLLAALPLLDLPSTAEAAHGSPEDAPGKVTGVAVSEEQAELGSMTVTWDATTPGAAPITDYMLFVVNAADETDYRNATVTTCGPSPSPEELAHKFSGLKSGATYEVKVRARNLIGERGPWSDTVEITLATG